MREHGDLAVQGVGTRCDRIQFRREALDLEDNLSSRERRPVTTVLSLGAAYGIERALERVGERGRLIS